MAEGNSIRAGDSRVLVTGAGGFIGSWIVMSLVERGNRPFIFDLDTSGRRLRALLTEDQLALVQFIRGDVTSQEEVERFVADNGITHAIHLAALQVPFCAADPVKGARVNVIGTLNIFEAARKHQDTLKSIVYASSSAVFGPEEFYGAGTVREGAPLMPTTHYGVYKQANEGNARVYFETAGISSIGLRPGTVYGVGRDQGLTSGPTKAIKATVAGQPYTLRFTGGIDMQYARDAAETFLRASQTAIQGAKAYTLRGTVIQTGEFIETLTRLLPRAKDLIRAEGTHLPVAYDFDDSALAKDLGPTPKTPLEQGIRETAEIFERLKCQGKLETSELTA